MSEASGLHVGIDASNIRQGGGVTHLSQLLKAADPVRSGVERVTVWASKITADALPACPWLEIRSPAWIEGSLPRRMLGQQIQLGRELVRAECDVLFSPGGTLPVWCPVPTVTMSQNMLPFEPAEARRFGRWSAMRLKMWLLRHSQGRSFLRASGLIFLTKYARRSVSDFLGGISCPVAMIPHGVEDRFVHSPRVQRSVDQYSTAQPFRLLYVSILMPYKHQVEVALAVHQLRAEGLPVAVRFIGASWRCYGREFEQLLHRLDPGKEYLHWSGGVPFDQLEGYYREADVFVFASSCENLPNIMIEAMAAGLPIASSNRGPMPEVLEEAGVYFEPETPSSIAGTLRELIHNVDLRAKLAASAYERSKNYSWVRCARETFEFIAKISSEYVTKSVRQK